MHRILIAIVSIFFLVASVQARDFTANEEKVLQAYLAYYGRPADPGGLSYWSGRLEQESGNLDSIINAFGSSQEYIDRFGGLSTTQLIVNLYDQLFGRLPDSGGLSYWVSEFNSGNRSLQKISLAIADGVTGDDVDIISNRLAFAKAYVSGLEDGSVAALSADDLAELTASVSSLGESFINATSRLFSQSGYTVYFVNGLNHCSAPTNSLSIDMYVDGTKVGTIPPGQKIPIKVSLGNHEIEYKKSDGSTSGILNLYVTSEGQERALWCDPGYSFDHENYMFASIGSYTDSDGDTYFDSYDDFPYDSAEYTDTDGDGYGDNADVFPNDPSKWIEAGDNSISENFAITASEWRYYNYAVRVGQVVTVSISNLDSDVDLYVSTSGQVNASNYECRPYKGGPIDESCDISINVDGTLYIGVYGFGGASAVQLDVTIVGQISDADGDGVADSSDAFPNDSSEYKDSDGDGVGDNADAFPNDSSESKDSDGDGYGDNSDVFPNDPSKWLETGDNGLSENFIIEAAEWRYYNYAVGVGQVVTVSISNLDSDVDLYVSTSGQVNASNYECRPYEGGTTDESCEIPINADGTLYIGVYGFGGASSVQLDVTIVGQISDGDGDGDGDGVADSSDAFPNDSSENKDSDGDGIGDNADVFPNDLSESKDSDGDGYGDNSDAFPNDSSEYKDSDGDGIGDNADAFPNDSSESKDSDGDGVGDNSDTSPNDSGAGDSGSSDGSDGGQVTGQKPFGIEYSVIANPTYHDDGINYINFNSTIFFNGNHLVPTYDGVYIMYLERDRVDAVRNFNPLRKPEEVEGETNPWYIAKIPYEQVLGCKDWCYDRKFDGTLLNINANMLNDRDFSADILYVKTADLRFYKHWLEGGQEFEVPSFFDPYGNFVPRNPDTDSVDYSQSYPTRLAHTWQGLTSQYVTNSRGDDYSKTPLGWVEVESVGETYDVSQFVGGQEVMFGESSDWNNGFQKESLHKLVFGNVVDTFKAWAYCDNCTIYEYFPVEHDEVIVILRGYESENSPNSYFTQVVKIFPAGTSGQNELLYASSYNDDESSGINVAVSPSWIFLSDGTAINRSSKERFYWLGTPDSNDAVQVNIALLLGAGIGLLGASDNIVLAQTGTAEEVNIVRITPNFSN
jgi:hypothetical protein